MSIKWGGRGCGHISRWSESVANWNGSPSLYLDFVDGTQTLDPRITFTRATTATFTGSNGLIQTAAINAPRFDYNPTTLAPLGLLIEEQRTNLLTYSEQFDNATWNKSNATITADAVMSPDGTMDADKLVEAATTGTHYAAQTFSALTGVYSVTCYVKAAERTNVILLAIGGTTPRAICFDLSTGTTYPEQFGGVSPPDLASSMTNVGNGWWRCRMSWTADGQTSLRIYTDSGNGNGSTTGDGISGIFIWGADLEAGAFPTSYIPTVASQVTRSADVAVMTGANFSSWYNAAEGTFYSEVIKLGNLNFQQVYQVNDGSSSNAMALGFGSGLHPLRFDVTTSGVSQAQITGIANTTALNTSLRTAAAYAVNDFAISGNGAAVATDTLGTVPVVNQLGIGYRTFSTPLTLTGTIRRIAYFPRRLANSELRAITA
jgi:hypothetical protein